MKILRHFIIVFGVMALSSCFMISCNNEPHKEWVYSDASGYPHVSIVQLLANPNRYHRKKVHVTGIMTLDPEGEDTAIYLTEIDAKYGVRINGLWVGSPVSDDLKVANLNLCYVEGVFDANNHGHRGLWPAAIVEVRDVVWKSDIRKPPAGR